MLRSAQYLPSAETGREQQVPYSGPSSRSFNPNGPQLTISAPAPAPMVLMNQRDDNRGSNTTAAVRANREYISNGEYQQPRLQIATHQVPYGGEAIQSYNQISDSRGGGNHTPGAAHDNSGSSINHARSGDAEESLEGRASSVSLRLAERKRLDQHSRGARLSYREGSPLGLTIEEMDDRGLLSGGSEVPYYEASYRQRSRRGMEMKRRSSRLKKREDSVATRSARIVGSFFHMLHVLIRRGLNFDELLRSYMEEGVEWISRDSFYRACTSLGLPFTSKQLHAIFHTYQSDQNYLNTEALLNDLYSRMEGSVYAPRSADSVSSSDMLLNGGDTVVWDGPSAGVSILVELRRMIIEASDRTNRSFDDIYRMFSRWDVGGTGTVTATQFLRVLSHLHVQFSEQDQDLLIELLDTNGEGRIDFDNLMTFCIGDDGNNITDLPEKFSAYHTLYGGEDHTTAGASVVSGEAAKSFDPQLQVAAPPSSPVATIHRGPAGVMKKQESTSGIGDLSIVKQPGGRIRPRTASVDSNRPEQLRDEMQRMHNNTNNRLTIISNDSSGQSSDPQNAAESPANRGHNLHHMHQSRRPLTANARVPDTVSVKKRVSKKSSDGMPMVDEFVVDVLSDDDIIDDDGDPHVFAPVEQNISSAAGRASFGYTNNPPYPGQFYDNNGLVRVPSSEPMGVPNNYDNSHILIHQGSDTFISGAFDSMTYDSLNLRQSGDASPTNIPKHFEKAQSYFSGNIPQYQIVSEMPPTLQALSVGPYSNNNNPVLPIIQPPHGYYNKGPEQRGAHDHQMYVPIIDNAYRNEDQRPRTAKNTVDLEPINRLQPVDRATHSGANGDDSRSGAALVKALRKEILHRHKDSGKTLYEIFRSFDIIGNRYFGPKDVQRAAAGFGIDVDDSEAIAMISVLALDGEQRVSFGEFAVFITDPDFAALQRKINGLVAQQYKLHGREYQLRVYNTLMMSSGPNDQGRITSSIPNSNAVSTGFVEKTLFEKALIDLGLVEKTNSSRSKSQSHLLSHVEVSRLAVRYDTHGRDQCSVAKFLRTLQSSEEWKRAEKYVSLMEEAAEEAQTAREELFQAPDGSLDGVYRSPHGIILNEELIDMAEYLGIRVLSEPFLLWIVDSALRAPLPEGWSTHTDKKGRSFYFNRFTGVSQWDHPADDEFRRLIDEYRSIFEAYRHKESEQKGLGQSNPIGIQEKFMKEYPPSLAVPSYVASNPPRRVDQPRTSHNPPLAVETYVNRGDSDQNYYDRNYNHVANQDSNSYGRNYGDARNSSNRQNYSDTPIEYTDQSNALVQAIRQMDPAELQDALNRGVDIASLVPTAASRQHYNDPMATPNNLPVVHHSSSAPRLNGVPVIDNNILYPQKSSSRPVKSAGVRRSPRTNRMPSSSENGYGTPTIVDRVIGSVKTIYSPTFEDANKPKRREDAVRQTAAQDSTQGGHRRNGGNGSSGKAQGTNMTIGNESARNQTTRPSSSNGLRHQKDSNTNSRPSSSHGAQLMKGSNAASRLKATAANAMPEPSSFGSPVRFVKAIDSQSFIEDEMFGDRLLNRLDTMVGRTR